ncbi:MAG: PAS domain-containing sensor histidine kinase [Chitinophagaceae bacterium]|nr:MAG: PAS domain-containing sensor histidine kinase [Chitinophagaceae bacterium]
MNVDSKFEALFQHASMGILVADEVGTIAMANKFLLGQFGYEKASELIGKRVEQLIPHRYKEGHSKYRDKYIEHPSPRAMGTGRDLFAIKKNGSEFPVEISLSHYESGGKKFVIAFVSDITKRKEIERDAILQKEQLAEINQKIEELNDELEQKVELRTGQLKELMQEVEASRDELSKALNKEKELSDLKSRFVSMASHEFRTPLSTILSSASLLAKYTEKTEQPNRDKHILRIKSSVNNLTGILNEFLSIGRIEDGKIQAHPQKFNIKDISAGVCSEMQALVINGQEIEYLHEGAQEVMLDPALFRNIVINLLSNAIKFSHTGGKIMVATAVNKKQVRLIVSDSGMGISKDDQQHLFERFFRAANATNIQGTGLGLHIVARYVELMNGKIEVESELENGTSFKLTFPQ